MADVIEVNDLTATSQDGWAVDYLIRREDGEQLHAEVRCWNKARVAAEKAGNAPALEAIADERAAAALAAAEAAASPALRGTVVISIWFDPADDGNLGRTSATSEPPTKAQVVSFTGDVASQIAVTRNRSHPRPRTAARALWAESFELIPAKKSDEAKRTTASM
jgi:hypothetical protein